MRLQPQLDRHLAPANRLGQAQSYRDGVPVIAVFFPINSDCRPHKELFSIADTRISTYKLLCLRHNLTTKRYGFKKLTCPVFIS
jgi:hypothetical protein